MYSWKTANLQQLYCTVRFLVVKRTLRSPLKWHFFSVNFCMKWTGLDVCGKYISFHMWFLLCKFLLEMDMCPNICGLKYISFESQVWCCQRENEVNFVWNVTPFYVNFCLKWRDSCNCVNVEMSQKFDTFFPWSLRLLNLHWCGFKLRWNVISFCVNFTSNWQMSDSCRIDLIVPCMRFAGESKDCVDVEIFGGGQIDIKINFVSSVIAESFRVFVLRK